MCFRFLQVMVNFVKSGELPHHDHGHVDGIDEVVIPAEGSQMVIREKIQPEEQDIDQKGQDGQEDKK